MANRVGPICKETCLAEQEEQIIKSKMAELGTDNFGSYARKGVKLLRSTVGSAVTTSLQVRATA